MHIEPAARIRPQASSWSLRGRRWRMLWAGLAVGLGALWASGAAHAAGVLVVHQQGLDFGLVAVGGTAPVQTVALRNPGDAPLTLTALGTPAGPFSSPSTTCGATLISGGACQISYTFEPTAAGNFSQSVTIASSVGNASVQLIGAAQGPAFPLVISATSFDFGATAVGSTSPGQRVMISNPTASPVTLNAAGGGIAAPFNAGTTCGGPSVTLAPGASCYFAYDFSPTALGPVTGSTSIQVTVGGVVKTVPVQASGEGIFPLVVSPTTFDFGEVTVGSTSPGQRVLISNPTANPVTLNAAGGGIAAPFNSATTCGGPSVTLAPGASCFFEYFFVPTALGAVTGSTSIQITVGGVAKTVPIAASGAGITAGGGTFPLVVSPTSFNFGATAVGDTTAGQLVMVTNPTASPVTTTVAGGGIAAPFNAGTTCGGPSVTLAPGASCYLAYDFSPTALGPVTRSTSIQVTVGAVMQTFPIQASGEGFFPLVVSPRSFDFGDVAVGGTTAGQLVMVTNPTASPVTTTVAGGGIPAPFNAGTTCGGPSVTLAPGASCYFVYDFSPTALGPATGTTGIQVSVSGATQLVPIATSGTGVGAAARLQVSPYLLDFGPVPYSTSAPPLDVTITNLGTGPMSSLAVDAPAAPFALSAGSCPATLAAGASCSLSYRYAAPAAASTDDATLAVNSPAGAGAIGLHASAVAAAAATGDGLTPVPTLGHGLLAALSALSAALAGLGLRQRRRAAAGR